MLNARSRQYMKFVFDARYFWFHLTLADLRAKYRRSLLGILWAILQPLAFTLILGGVVGAILKTPIADYLPYVLSGFIVWEFITASLVSACGAFINAEYYIKQYTHPLAIYPLRHVLAALITLSIALTGLIIWVAFWRPINLFYVPEVVFFALPLAALWVWPLAIIVAFIASVFRDFQQLIIIILQIVCYVSPILFQPKMFYAAHLNFLVDDNPFYYLVNLFRAPLLDGRMPSIQSFAYVIGSLVLFWLIAGVIIYKQERKLIFYL